MNDEHPRVSLSGTVQSLELKKGYWVQCNLRGKYNTENGGYDKHACVQVMVDEGTEEFVVHIPKNVTIKYWEEEFRKRMEEE